MKSDGRRTKIAGNSRLQDFDELDQYWRERTFKRPPDTIGPVADKDNDTPAKK